MDWSNPLIYVVAISALGIIGSVAVLIFKAGRWFQSTESLKTDVGSLKTDVGSLKADVGSLKTDVGSLETRVGSLETRVGSLEAEVGSMKELMGKFAEELRFDIKQIMLRLPPPQGTASQSPIELTDFGRVLSSDVGGRDWARETAARLVDRIRGRQPLEVHEFSMDYILNDANFPEEFHRKMRECVSDRGTTPEEVRKVLAVELRDALLSNLSDN